ncbi:hypothetical protein [Mycobacterium sp. C31M]
MRHIPRTLLVGVATALALGTVAACSGAPQTPTATATPASPAASFPASAKYIADMPAADGRTMTIGIAVDGDEFAAYACNGVDDEAWFFGDQSDGNITADGKFRDTLTARVEGDDVVGDLAMNGISYRFTAASVPAPAGMYTGELNGTRATWVVRPGDSATGVEVTARPAATGGPDPATLDDQQFRATVRNIRDLGPASPILSLDNGSGTADIGGQVVTLTVVNGDFRL